MSSHGVSLCCPSNDFSGLSRASIRVPSTVSITTRLGSKIARLSWPGKSTVRRSFRVSAVKTTFLRKSPLLLTYQIPPVMDAATFIACTLFQRSRPPCASTASFSNSFTFMVRFLWWRDPECVPSHGCQEGGALIVGPKGVGRKDCRNIRKISLAEEIKVYLSERHMFVLVRASPENGLSPSGTRGNTLYDQELTA